jgi:hypothetical protein
MHSVLFSNNTKLGEQFTDMASSTSHNTCGPPLDTGATRNTISAKDICLMNDSVDIITCVTGNSGLYPGPFISDEETEWLPDLSRELPQVIGEHFSDFRFHVNFGLEDEDIELLELSHAEDLPSYETAVRLLQNYLAQCTTGYQFYRPISSARCMLVTNKSINSLGSGEQY